MEDLKTQLAVGWQTKENTNILRNFYRFVLNHRPVNANNSTNASNHLFSNLFDTDRKIGGIDFLNKELLNWSITKRLLYNDTNR